MTLKLKSDTNTTITTELVSEVVVKGTGDGEIDTINLLPKSILSIFKDFNLDRQAKLRAWAYIKRIVDDDVYKADDEGMTP